MAVGLDAEIEALGGAGVGIYPADLRVADGEVAGAVVPDGGLVPTVARPHLQQHQQLHRPRGRRGVEQLVRPVDLLEPETGAEPAAALALVALDRVLHVIEELVGGLHGQGMVRLERTETRAGAPVRGDPCLPAATLPRHELEERPERGTRMIFFLLNFVCNVIFSSR